MTLRDRVLIKYHHEIQGEVVIITKESIEQYLIDVKKLIKEQKYIIEPRDKNDDLYDQYVLPKDKSEQILLSLAVDDFSEIVKYKNKNGEYVPHYVFGKKVVLTPRYRTHEEEVSLYIKFNKKSNMFVVVVSFHEEEYPMVYYFK